MINKYLLSLFTTGCFLAVFTTMSFAECECVPLGAGQKGSYFTIGYNEFDFNSLSKKSGVTVDQDLSRLHGINLELRGDDKNGFLRGIVNWVESISSTYKEGVASGTPGIAVSSKELIWNAEIAYGFKVANFGPVTISPYLGVGYNDWSKGTNNSVDVEKEFTWPYASVGINGAWRVFKDMYVMVDGACELPYNPQVKSYFKKTYDETKVNISSRPGYRIQSTITYNIYHKANKTDIYLFWTPYYHQWQLGNSEEFHLTQGGSDTPAVDQQYYSKTIMYGFNFGIGFHY